jgi:uncharacterized protein YeeX (DUF496 family)
MAEAQSLPVATDTISVIQGMLERESGVKPQAPEQPQAQSTEEQTPQEPSQPETEEAPAEDNRQVEGDEPQDQRVAEIPLDQLEAIQLEVEVSGEGGKVTEKPTIKELKLGYMRDKDYRAKTAEVARQRDEVGEKIRQGIEGERANYLNTLQQLQTAFVESVAPELMNVNWNDLAANNPAEYVRLLNRKDQLQQVLQGMQSKQQEVLTKKKAEQGQATKAAAARARATLEQEIPGWNDALYQSLMKTGIENYGFKPEEVSSWVDPRAIKLLHDAKQFRELNTTKPVVNNRVVTPPKVIKPGAASTVTQSQKLQESSMKKLQTSGRIEDAAAVIRARLG